MDYRCVTDPAAVKAYLHGANIVAFDFETSPPPKYRDDSRAALDANKAHIVGVSFSVSEGSAIYVPLRHRTGTLCDVMAITCLLTEFAANLHIIKVAHNLAFETMFLYAQGIVLQPPCYDTLAAAQMTLKNNTEFRKLSDGGLKKLASELLDAEMPSFGAVTEGRHFDELDPQDAETIRYACADSDYALRLYNLFNGWFDTFLPKHRFMVEQAESPTSVYCGVMKHNGLLMDKPAMLEHQTKAEAKLSELRERITFFIGEVDIGANAGTQAFKDYLFKDLGLPVLKTTEKFKEAADDQTMILLTEWCQGNRPELVPLFELVQEYRKWSKIKTTYIDGYLQHINNATGRIHPDLMPLATETGRFASRNPNLQNCPRKDNDPIGVRSFIIAPEGKLLLSLDFSQIELRVGAFYCRDEKMLDTYCQNGDIHARTTAVIYHIPFSEAVDKHGEYYKERRTIAKNCNFGVFYGLYAKGLHRTLKFKAGLDKPLPECEEIIRSLKAGYPALDRWQEDVKQRATLRRYTETWLGRRRYLPGISSPDWAKKSYAERCALNTPIQGTAADILKLALGRIVAGLPDRLWLRPLLQIHDELLFELPVDRLNEAVDFIRACMEAQPFPEFDVPIIAEAAFGNTFGSLQDIARA